MMSVKHNVQEEHNAHVYSYHPFSSTNIAHLLIVVLAINQHHIFCASWMQIHVLISQTNANLDHSYLYYFIFNKQIIKL
jgi:hypothetical protein